MNSSRRAVSALVVTWNNDETLDACLSALREELPVGGEIVLLDNGSVDRSVAIALHYTARVIRRQDNVGFAAGMNVLSEAAHGDVLVLVNPDLFVQQGGIKALLKYLPTGLERRIIGGLLLRPDGKPEIASARPIPSAGDFIRWLFTRRQPKATVPERARIVDAVSGAFFATSATLWRELGGFDSKYVHSGEDLDLFWRAARHGAEVWFEPAARATHVGGGSVRRTPASLDAIRLAGALRLVEKRQGRAAALAFRATLLLLAWVALLADRLRVRALPSGRRARARAFVELGLRGTRAQPQLPSQPAEGRPV